MYYLACLLPTSGNRIRYIIRLNPRVDLHKASPMIRMKQPDLVGKFPLF